MRKGESRDTGKRLRDGRLNVEGGSDVCCSVAWSYRTEATAAMPGAKQELRGNKKKKGKKGDKDKEASLCGQRQEEVQWKRKK